MSDPAVVVVADVHGLAGSAGELRGLLAELAAASAGEGGCVEFRLLSDTEPWDFVLLSSWSGDEALAAHYETPHYRRYRDAVGVLLARPSGVVIHRIGATTHALDPNPPDPNTFD